jgi:S-adenosyl-L-methionine hydrolase (adenosine-forming)
MTTIALGGSTRPHCLICALLILALLGLPSSVVAQETVDKSHPLIVFMTDYGAIDDSVAICKGVIYSTAPDARIVDLTHDVKPYSIEDGARFLYGAAPYFPAGTVFLAVIDPGVGSARRGLVVKSRRKQYFVLPDNGLITEVEERDGIEAVREITNVAWMLGSKLSTTFHGRDVFSPIAAHLAHGEEWIQVGPQVPAENLQRVKITSARLGPRGITGHVVAIDGPFGNLITDIAAEDFQKLGYEHRDEVSILLNDRSMSRSLPMPFMRTFSDVPENQPLLYIDSRGRVALAINKGNFAKKHNIRPPASITIRKAGTD